MIDYRTLLNDAQYAAVTCDAPSVLVVAGAGSGKTRTIVYRLAWLIEHGADPASLLLLTFTRKAAREMLARAMQLLSTDTSGVQGGTFHAFAYKTLKIWPPAWLEGRRFSLLDQSDTIALLQQCKNDLKMTGRSFPKVQTIQGFLSKSRNKEEDLADTIARDAYQLIPYTENIQRIGKRYKEKCHEQGLLDYDDLLFELEDLLRTNELARASIHHRFTHIMVDEYQDTNPVQARIIQLLASHAPDEEATHIMAVGDEAQSIYAFRGATIRNILDFPRLFPNTELIRLEENYRSTQPILDVANVVLENAEESFKKVLYTNIKSDVPVFLYKPRNEDKQAEMVVAAIEDLLQTYAAEEIAVLFRSSYHSYFVEAALQRIGLPFRKFGGLKYTEAAHIKDCLAFVRLINNPTDMSAFSRVAGMHQGIGPKTIERMFEALRTGNTDALTKAIARFPAFAADMAFINTQNTAKPPAEIVQAIVSHFQPTLEVRYADDWPSRKQSLEEIIQVAASYSALDDFIADLALDPVKDDEDSKQGKIVLSTIHSAKGLEWDAVLLLDLVCGRFPSNFALARSEDLEEERRLMYVACTRARKELHLYTPRTIFNRMERTDCAAEQSPFIAEIQSLPASSALQMGTQLARNRSSLPATEEESSHEEAPAPTSASKADTCHHAIFGSGEILEILDGNIYKVKFKNHGVKTILGTYLSF